MGLAHPLQSNPPTQPADYSAEDFASSDPRVESPLYADPAEAILRGDPSLTDEHRATLWTIFHEAKNPDDLAQRLQWHSASNETRHLLVQAKGLTAPTPDPVDRTVDALHRVAALPRNVLEMAEKYPVAAKSLIQAAQKVFQK